MDLRRFVRDLAYRWRLIRQVTQLGAEIAIQPTYSRVFLTGDSLSRASRAKQCIGSQGDLSNIRPWQNAISDRWYTQLIPASAEPLMELERNAEFLNGLGLVNAKPHVASLAKLNIDVSHFNLPEKYFIIFPGASTIKRMWPNSRFAEISRYIHRKTGWVMVVCGSKNEAHLGAEIIRTSVIKSLDLTGKTSLPEFVEIVRGAQILIGNDTSAIHIAAAVNTRSVCILGGGHFGRFLPYSSSVTGMKPAPVYVEMKCYGCNWQCTKEHNPNERWPCVSAISVKSVQEAVDQMLDKA